MTITRSEVLLLGVLALLTALVALVPWKKLILEYREYEASKYTYSRAATDERAPPVLPDWDVKAEYYPAQGALRLQLSHAYIEPSPDLLVIARFSAGRGAPPIAETFLRNHSGGVYSAQNLRLPKGDWVMSLTGRRKLEFVFRREEILTVE